MKKGFTAVIASHWVQGFAIGRTIFGQPCKEWFAGKHNDKELIKTIVARYQLMIKLWQSR